MASIYYPIIGKAKELPYYVGGIGIDFEQTDIYRPEGFEHPQIIIFTSGEGVLQFGDESVSVTPGVAVFIPANIPHCYYYTGGEWQTWWINFSGKGVDSLLADLGLSGICIYNLEDYERLMRILRRIYNTLSDDNLFGSCYASSGLYELLIEFYRSSQRLSTNLFGKESPISKAIDYINRNYSSKITMEDLCREANLSETHLCRLFRKYFEMRPMEYLNRKRIIQSKELLKNSYMSVETITLKSGFGSISYFGKLFKKYEGMSPSEYREAIAKNKNN